MRTPEEIRDHMIRIRDTHLREFAIEPPPPAVAAALSALFKPALSKKDSTLDVGFSIIVTSASRDGDELVKLQRQVARQFLIAFRRTLQWSKVSSNDIIRLRTDDRAVDSPYDAFNDPEVLIIMENSIPSTVKPGDQWINDIVESRATQRKPTLFVSPILSEVFPQNRYLLSSDGSLEKIKFTIPMNKPLPRTEKTMKTSLSTL
jgi:hypothetical protein